MDTGRVKSYPVAYGDRSVLRFLGYKKGDLPDARTSGRLAATREIARPLFQGMAARRTLDRAELPEGFPCSPRTVRATLALCTVGPGVEEASISAMGKGEYLDGILLDAIGSAAVEALADAVEAEIQEEASSAGYLAAHRVSPGYAKWPVAGQRDLFALLPASETGIVLLPSLMMQPRKSVSFLVAWRRDPEGAAGDPGCRQCSQPRCLSRKENP